MKTIIGRAKSVRKRTPTFPSRWAYYWDFSPWGSGYLRTGQGPGAIILQRSPEILGDIRTGEVYTNEPQTAAQ